VKLPPDTSRARVADLEALQPEFRRKVEALITRMQADGFDPMIWETYRTPARAKLLSDRGTGAKPRADGSIPIGMHQLGLAVDIVSASKMWTPPAAFWAALGKHAEAIGLTWGGRWKRVDKPHVQAVPVKEQEAKRAEYRAKGFAGVTYVA
jgi:peptidoglycan L-alanyl-D-glutamate endopeptidase CwlK